MDRSTRKQWSLIQSTHFCSIIAHRAILSPNGQKEEDHTLKRHARKGTPMFKARICCLFLLGLALPGIFSLMQVNADGGAPNLAYVPADSQGVGIIDVAQQRVIGGLAF